mmetsp:Transcript_29527/g.44924  ORF Transcript_29527/g.44924 Transcript_29527/m.44924 type:complete len:90 (-) Transcript_29527:885-1154(-)
MLQHRLAFPEISRQPQLPNLGGTTTDTYNPYVSQSVFDDYSQGPTAMGRRTFFQGDQDFNYRELITNLNRIRPGQKGGEGESEKKRFKS